MKKIVLATVAFCVLVFGGDYEEGSKALDNHNDELAIKLWKKAAEAGDPRAINDLATMYQLGGPGLKQDMKKAVELYEKATKMGYAPAYENLALCYKFGRGVPKDLEKAKKIKAAGEKFLISANDTVSLYELGNNYSFGLNGFSVDKAKAFQAYKKAADMGDRVSQYEVGYMFHIGNGIQKDYKKAAEYYQKSADQGYALAQNNLGYLYMNGLGVHKNDKKAYELFKKASKKGEKNAITNLKVLCNDSPEVCTQ